MAIKPKEGTCIECPYFGPLIAKRCSKHYWQYRDILKTPKEPKARKPIAPVSKKRAAELKQYTKQNRAYAAEGHPCAAADMEDETGLPCGGPATDTNHMAGKENKRLLTTEDRNRLCRAHHIWCTEHTARAIELGLMKSKHRLP